MELNELGRWRLKIMDTGLQSLDSRAGPLKTGILSKFQRGAKKKKRRKKKEKKREEECNLL